MRAGAVVGAGALLLAGALGSWWIAGGPARQGMEPADAGACAPSLSMSPFPAPARADLDRFVLPVGPVPVAPLRALVCRYGPHGTLASGLQLDPARTASLAAAVAAPIAPWPGGWPDDALVAKRIPPLTPAQLADVAPSAGRPTDCATPSGAADVITFAYPKGPAVVVRVRTDLCQDLTNGGMTVRLPPRIAEALAALPR